MTKKKDLVLEVFDTRTGKFDKKPPKSDVYEYFLESFQLYEAERDIVSKMLIQQLSDPDKKDESKD